MTTREVDGVIVRAPVQHPAQQPFGGNFREILPEKFEHWNSIWKRFWRLSRAGTFEAFFDALAAMSETAHLVQMFDSTIVRAHVSAAGAKGGSMVRRSVARVAASRPRFT